MNRHMKRHAITPLTSNLPPKVARREPKIINLPTNDHFLEQQEIQSMFDQNSQRGLGVTPTDVPEEGCQFFQEEQPWGTDQNLRQVYVQSFHRIRDSETNHCRSRIFLRYLHHNRAPLIETITQAIEDIFLRQTNAFKINLSFFLFCNTERLESFDITMPASSY